MSIKENKELVKIEIQENGGKLLTSSLNVAEVFGKEHYQVLRDIRELDCSDSFRAYNFVGSSYTSEQNKQQPMYLMTKDGFAFLVMGYTGAKAAQFKEAYIKKFNEMEAMIRQQLPSSFADALRLLAEKVEHEELNKPKIQQFDMFISAENYKSIGTVAKELGTGRTRLFKLLRDKQILMRNNIPYQAYVDRGYFVVKEKPITMGEANINYSQVYVTSKGISYLSKIVTEDK